MHLNAGSRCEWIFIYQKFQRHIATKIHSPSVNVVQENTVIVANLPLRVTFNIGQVFFSPVMRLFIFI
jgi:hypothetical protein